MVKENEYLNSKVNIVSLEAQDLVEIWEKPKGISQGSPQLQEEAGGGVIHA